MTNSSSFNAPWPKRRLKFCATYNDEVLPENTDDFASIEYIEISDVSLVDGIQNTSLIEFHEAPSRARRKVRSGDVLISTVRTYLKAIASVEKAPDNLIASTGFCVIRPSQNLYPSFAGWVVKSGEFVGEVVSRSVGVSYPAINASQLVDIEIPLPPLPTQQRIAAFLDEKTARIDALIAKKQALLERLAEKRQALITQAVTKGLNPAAPMKDSGIEWLGQIPKHWEVKRLKFGTSKIGSGVTPRGGASVYVNEGVALLRSQNIHFNGLELDDVVFIDEETDSEMNQTKVQYLDVLLNITGASIGRCCIFDRKEISANVNQHVCIVRMNEHHIPQYITLLLCSAVGQLQIDLSQNGASREGLNFGDLGNFNFPSPPLLEQKEIALQTIQALNEIQNQKDKIIHSILILSEYRATLITAAVTGQIPELQ